MSGAMLRTNPKFGRLHAILGVPPSFARGLLEFLWDTVQETGNPIIGNAESVEMAAGWTGEPGKLCQALLACGCGKAGFIEEVSALAGVYQLHDLIENSPPEVVRRWVRQFARLQQGTTVAEVYASTTRKRPTEPERVKADERSCQPTAGDAACMPAQNCNPAAESCKPPLDVVLAEAIAARRAAMIEQQNNDASTKAEPGKPADAHPYQAQAILNVFQLADFDGDPNEFIAHYRSVRSDPSHPEYGAEFDDIIFRWMERKQAQQQGKAGRQAASAMA